MRAGFVVSGVALAALACGGGQPHDRAPEQARPSRSAPEAAPATPAVSEVGVEPRADQTRRVLFVGTSLTAGLGVDPSQAYPAVLAQLADSAGFHVEVVNAGVSGETSAGALRRIDWLLREPVDVVVLETGANDGLRGLDVDSTRANIQAIVRKAKAAQPSAHVLLVQMEAPPNLGAGYTTRFREMFPDIARDEGIALAPFLLDGVAGRAALNQSDGIHPNPAGARRAAENVWPALRSELTATGSG